MRIGICDDVKMEMKKAEEFLKKDKILNIDKDIITLYSPEDVLSDLEEQTFRCDIMIMDIEFEREGFNGITLSKKINEQMPGCQIIYLTNILEFAPEVYETEHCYFVLKKNMEIMLPQAVVKAKRILEKLLKQAAIEVVSEGHTVFIMQKDILYVERQERKIIIYTQKRNYVSYMSLSVFLKYVDDDIMRCHGGYIVNLSHIIYLGSEYITLDNGVEIPIGKTYRDKLRQKYLIYWSSRV